MIMLQAAKIYGADAHKDQKYGDGLYSIHLYDTEQVARRFGCTDEDILAATWLHDTVEDTPTTVEQLRSLFNDRVASLVYSVTNEPGINRAERHAKTYHKIKQHPDNLFLKLCDRIANVEACIKYRDSRMKMYQKEWASFKAELYTPGVHEPLWQHLASLLET